MSALLSIADVSRSYDGMPVLRHTSLDVAAGELVALTGPSGSGKSTLLMIAGGWDQPDSGTVTVHPPMPELPVSDQPWDALAFVPQSISLFEELTVADNLAFAARTATEPPDHRSCWRRWIWRNWPTGCRARFRAGSNSGARWRGRWPRVRWCFWPTNRRRIRTARTRRWC